MEAPTRRNKGRTTLLSGRAVHAAKSSAQFFEFDNGPGMRAGRANPSDFRVCWGWQLYFTGGDAAPDNYYQ